MSQQLQDQINTLASQEQVDESGAREIFDRFIEKLDGGEIRSAEPKSAGSGWKVNQWVKQGILLGFQLGELTEMPGEVFNYFDKDTFPVKDLQPDDGVRVVPGGSSIRRGAYVAPGVICMPPMYINVGAYVDEGTMVDSHALVGSCAQIGSNVHLSAGTQIGGVLEPVGAMPVIVEDNVFIGGGCGVFEGCSLREGAVLAADVTLTGSSRVYDLVNETIHTAGDDGLTIPEGAVVVPGSRPVDSEFGRDHGLSLATPVIVKYRDQSTEASTVLEEALR